MEPVPQRGCEEVAPIEKPHNFKTELVDDFTVSKCEDCGAEFAEVKVNLLKRSSLTQTAPYFNANVKVSLYKMGDGKYTKVAEAAADSKTGVATFSGTGVENEPSMVLDRGVTDENGELTLKLASSFDFVNATGMSLTYSDWNSDDYYMYSGGLNLSASDRNETKIVYFVSKNQAHTVKVKAGDNFIEGVKVKPSISFTNSNTAMTPITGRGLTKRAERTPPIMISLSSTRTGRDA